MAAMFYYPTDLDDTTTQATATMDGLASNNESQPGWFYTGENSYDANDRQPAVAVPVLLTVVDSIIAVFAITGNSLVILAVVRFPHMRTATNLFVMSLAVADLLVGICIPYYVLFYFKDFVDWTCGYWACLLRYFTVLYATISSMLANIGVAVDRYIAIVHPLAYPRLIGTRRVSVTILLGWLYVGVVTSLPLMGVNTWDDEAVESCVSKEIECDLFYVASREYVMLAVGFHVVLTLVVTVTLYLRIFREAWRQQRTVAMLEVDPRLRKETRTARTMALVFGVSLVSLAPYLVAITLPYANAHIRENNAWESIHGWSTYKKFAVCSYLGKSSLNPLIYGWKNRDFRLAFCKLLKIKNRYDPADFGFVASPVSARNGAEKDNKRHRQQQRVFTVSLMDSHESIPRG